MQLITESMKKVSRWPDRSVWLFTCLVCGVLFDHKWHWNEKDPCVVTCPCGAVMETDCDEKPYTVAVVK